MVRLPLLLLTFLLLVPLPAGAAVVWRGDFETGDLSQWTKAQVVNGERLKVVRSPVKQGGYAIKVTVKQGDNPIDASGNRNELVYTSYEPEGTERFYRWQTMFDESYPSNSTWQLFTQWHHSGSGGSPPVEFDVNGEEIVLFVDGRDVWSAPLVRGVWHDFVFHVKWSPSSKVGFVELYYDGQLALPKLMIATQFAGQTNYLKQGLYRNSTIREDGTVYHDGFVAGETLDDVWPERNAPPPAPAPEEPTAGTGGGEPAQPVAGEVDLGAALPGAGGAMGGAEQPRAGAAPHAVPEVGCSAAVGEVPSLLGGLLLLGALLRRRRG